MSAETTLLTTIVPAGSALLGSLVGGFVQWKLLHTTQQGQLALETRKRSLEAQAAQRSEATANLRNAHKLLNKLDREFSLLNTLVLLEAGTTDQQFDQRYLAAWELMDELGQIADLYLPTIADDVKHIHGESTKFWGYFKPALVSRAQGRPYEERQAQLSEVHKAVTEISTSVKHAKHELIRLADRLGLPNTP